MPSGIPKTPSPELTTGSYELTFQELKVVVSASPSENTSEREMPTFQPSSPPAKIARFAVEYSSGLRVRGSPSLQSEELGRVSSGENVAYVEEVRL